MADDTCLVPGCEKPAKKRDLCGAHYQSWRNDQLGLCTVEDCGRKEKALGLCASHYDEHRVGGKTCLVNDCEKVGAVEGYCRMHYNRMLRHGVAGDAAPLRKMARSCRVEGCDFDAVGRDDLCRTHLERLQKYGSLEGRLCVQCGLKSVRGSDFCADHHLASEIERIVLGQRLGSRRNGYVVHKVLDLTLHEHRVVMERVVGRSLHPFETPHHKNGIRDDNQPDNLELWTKPQPAGQRPEDLAAWVVEFYPDLVREALERKESR